MSLHILLVEDNSAEANIVRMYLADQFPEARLRHEKYLRDAERALANEHYDVVLLDLTLPDATGEDTFQRVKATNTKAATVVLTGRQDEDLAITLVQAGAQDFLCKKDMSPASLFRSITHSYERNQLKQQLDQKVAELEVAMAEIKTLKGFLPICMYCKQIRDDDGYWTRLEEYLTQNTEAQLSHGICEKCIEEKYPDV